jgi:hypothetical protein
MKKLCEQYSAKIKEVQGRPWTYQPRKFLEQEFFEIANANISWKIQVEHILWMLEEIPRLWKEGNDLGNSNEEIIESNKMWGKAHRWLGFVQGWMWAKSICSIDYLRDSGRDHVSK